jgi:hypothetical protein
MEKSMKKVLNVYISQFANKDKSFTLYDGKSNESKETLDGIVSVINEFKKAKIFDNENVINFDIPYGIRLLILRL